jgi:hypothetical protein
MEERPHFQTNQRLLIRCNCLAKLKQQNRNDREDRKEKLLRGLCGLSGNFILEDWKFTMCSP